LFSFISSLRRKIDLSILQKKNFFHMTGKRKKKGRTARGAKFYFLGIEYRQK
jgi:hypothetical protein